MPTAHRIVKARHARTAFSGEGARLAGGRWNRPRGGGRLRLGFVHFRIEIPDGVGIRRCRRSPPGWRAEPPQESSMRYGSRWLQQGRTAVLEVPAAIVPSEMSCLLNPAYPDFRRMGIGRPLPFVTDPRMWK